MSGVDRAQMLYNPGRCAENVRLRIAEAYAAMRLAYGERAGAPAGDALEAAVCADLGIPVEVVRECADFQLACSLGGAAGMAGQAAPAADDSGPAPDRAGDGDGAGLFGFDFSC